VAGSHRAAPIVAFLNGRARRTVDLAFRNGRRSSSSTPYRQRRTEPFEMQRARFRHQAADVVQVTVRLTTRSMLSGVIPARRRFAWSREAARMGRFSHQNRYRQGYAPVPYRPPDVVRGWITGCMNLPLTPKPVQRPSVHNEDRPRPESAHSHRDHGRLESRS